MENQKGQMGSLGVAEEQKETQDRKRCVKCASNSFQPVQGGAHGKFVPFKDIIFRTPSEQNQDSACCGVSVCLKTKQQQDLRRRRCNKK